MMYSVLMLTDFNAVYCEPHYLIDVYVLSSRQFKISLQNSKRSFHRAAICILFGKIGRTASEEVII